MDRSASRGPGRAADPGRRVRRRRSSSPTAPRASIGCASCAHDDLAGAGQVLASRYEVGCLELARNTSYDAAAVTVRDESYLRPAVWSSVDLRSGAATEVQRGEAPGFDPEQYAVERRTFPAPDGTAVPAVLVRHRETPLDGTAPCLIYAYGAYEAVDEPEWDAALPSVLDRGVVWVHALVRGGGEGGRRWWLDGSMRHKQHTFDDLIAVADGLDRDGLVDGTRIATRGLSAGGLLQGVVFTPATRPMAGRRGGGAVRRRGHHDVRRGHAADDHRVGGVGRPAHPRAVRLDARVLAVRQPAARGRPTRPPGDRRGPRPARDGAGTRQVGGRAAALRPGVVSHGACSAARPAPGRTSVRPGGSRTSVTRPRSTPGSSTSIIRRV